MSLLNAETFNQLHQSSNYEIQELPIKVLQIGEGNFLRGFADWMLQEAIKQNKFHGSIAVTQPRAAGKPKIDELKKQDGLYTLVTRGIEQGKPVEKAEIIEVFKHVINPYEEWTTFLKLAEEQELRFVISNTTEAGLIYIEESYSEHAPIHSFAGKLTALLFKRYEFFSGDRNKGLICLPCELIERNGDALKALVLRYAQAWRLPAGFIDWVEAHNYFLNSLVDRIVTGYPTSEQAQAWFLKWGYEDAQLTTAEPYHLWVIEGQQLAEELPLHLAGLNVLWVVDLKPYQQRKVAILNGAHTALALLGLLKDEQEVRLAMENTVLERHIKQLIADEVIPALPYERAELISYAEQVYERFMNPYIQHRLADIAMNSLSKFKTRLWPAAQLYLQKNGQLPEQLLTALASLIRYYQVKKDSKDYIGTSLSGQLFLVRDDEQLLVWLAQVWSRYAEHKNLTLTLTQLMEHEAWWGENLNKAYPLLVSQLERKLIEMEWF